MNIPQGHIIVEEVKYHWYYHPKKDCTYIFTGSECIGKIGGKKGSKEINMYIKGYETRWLKGKEFGRAELSAEK